MSIIQLNIATPPKDLGGFTVRRLLPSPKRKMVGPFIFFDHIGPAEFSAGQGINVRPHPHIGLATVTYLFEGEILHRDSLGSLQKILPKEVNWMTAGKGIVHSERTDAKELSAPHRLHGIQTWIALPREAEECEPEFFHYIADLIPEINLPGVKLRLIAGDAYGKKSPVKIYSPLFYIEGHLESGASLILPQDYSELAVYNISGDIKVGKEPIPTATMTILNSGEITLSADSPAHIMLLGGEPFPEKRYLEWNLVSSSKERIEQAKKDWKEKRFSTIPGDNLEFIPLPELPKEGEIL